MEEKYKISSITHIIISVVTFDKSFWKVSDEEASPHSKFDFPFTLYFLYSPYMRQHQKYMLTEYKSFRLMYYARTIIYSPFIIVSDERNIHAFAFNIKCCIFLSNNLNCQIFWSLYLVFFNRLIQLSIIYLFLFEVSTKLNVPYNLSLVLYNNL